MRGTCGRKMSGRAHGGHRPGPLKQQNKAHKHGRHRSKGQQSDSTKGRVGMKVLSRQSRHEQSKAGKKNKMKQLRNNKRHEVLEAKRGRGGEGVPPHLIVIIPLDPSLQPAHIFKLLTSACNCEDGLSFAPTYTVVFPLSKQRFSLVFPPSTDLYATLDLAKVADSLLFVYSGSIRELTPFSQLLLDCCSLQGLPTTTHAVMGFNQLSGKALSKAKKLVQSLINKRFPTSRLHQLDSEQDSANLLRHISNQKRLPVHCRDSHAHLLAERVSYDGEQQTLRVTGYLRSRPLSVNGLVHVPGVGDFQMKQIDAATDLCPLKPSHSQGTTSSMEESGMAEEGMDEDIKVLELADPAKQESLVGEVVPDPMEGEQTWPTDEELKAAKEELKASQGVRHERRRVPAGTSEYQAAWIIEDSEGEGEESGSEEDEGVEFDVVGGAIQPVEDDSSTEGDGESIAGSEMDTDTMTLPDADKYDVHYDLESEQQQLALLRAEREDKMFPDEIDTPIDTLAKIRFQKYRGLKSFRHSDWDPRENLPRDYARIYQFDNFDRTRRRVLATGAGKRKREEGDEQGALPGWCITLHIDKVPPSVAERCQGGHTPLLVYGLMPHENKMSVVHFAIRRAPSFTEPIKSKERLIFHCGVRRYSAAPIFSQHTTGNKHKFEKFLHPDTTSVASVFAPVSYPPQPVLIFKALADGSHVLVASGSLLSVNPSRVICKRIVLSGHPFKINRKSAVIRYMFYNREDIMWFKPVELRTKYGRRGHIKEPLGTHGHMKCVFDGHLKAQDTVLMNLYKRVFPKWTYDATLPCPLAWTSNEGPDTETMQ